MTRKALTIVATAILTLGMMSALGCSSPETQSGNSSASEAQTSNQISVYSREDGSGTRGAFVELFGLEEKDASGNKIDMTTDAAAITNSTSVMMTSVASDPDAIGYISLGSLNDTVKAVKIDGIEATAQNVKSGDYKVSRPFNIVFAENLSAPA
ncbi:MAG: phosphate ABC transporter substrate-binding protein, partial [Eggerthellaceae bacterium]|nr:phosphate ABC transporter substrate-binding protein [Eggerthellaceae bacterium]